MKKQKKQFIILLALLVICIGAFFAAKLYNSRQEEKEAAETEAATIHVTDIAVEDITAFSYVLEGETLAFSYDGEAWTYDGDTTVDIDEDTVNTMLQTAASITTEERISEYSKLEDYGLEEPTNTIELKTADKSITIYLGNMNAILGEYYLMTSESEDIYLAGSSLASYFNKTVEALTVEEIETESTETVENTEDME